MMLLVFQAGANRYGLRTAQVREVVPGLLPRSVPHAPPEVTGLVDFRGQVVPVVDLGRLLTGTPCSSRLNTRIILMDIVLPDGSARLLGLLAERVNQTLKVDPQKVIQPAIKAETAPYLNGILQDEHGMIQLVEAHTILTTEIVAALSTAETEKA